MGAGRTALSLGARAHYGGHNIVIKPAGRGRRHATSNWIMVLIIMPTHECRSSASRRRTRKLVLHTDTHTHTQLLIILFVSRMQSKISDKPTFTHSTTSRCCCCVFCVVVCGCVSRYSTRKTACSTPGWKTWHGSVRVRVKKIVCSNRIIGVHLCIYVDAYGVSNVERGLHWKTIERVAHRLIAGNSWLTNGHTGTWAFVTGITRCVT